ncbi:MAG: hypothetical protein OXC95_07055 [Dehalococcoidia bacterium]|nr:hypothetical protein [Dehalococcoidia bacterium]
MNRVFTFFYDHAGKIILLGLVERLIGYLYPFGLLWTREHLWWYRSSEVLGTLQMLFNALIYALVICYLVELTLRRREEQK